MAKIQTTYVNEWPVMGPLGAKETALLQQNLSADEKILGTVIGNFGQAVVATDRKVLIIKSGMMSGQTFGGKATSFDYRALVGVEVRQGFAQGEFEILAGGLANNQSNRIRGKVNMAEQPNGLVFPKVSVSSFNAMATKIREMSASVHQPSAAAQQVPDENPTIAAIRQLSELLREGIISEEEFASKKADLLSKM